MAKRPSKWKKQHAHICRCPLPRWQCICDYFLETSRTSEQSFCHSKIQRFLINMSEKVTEVNNVYETPHFYEKPKDPEGMHFVFKYIFTFQARRVCKLQSFFNARLECIEER